MTKPYGVKLEYSDINISTEEFAIIQEYSQRRITVTELSNKLGELGLQIIRLTDNSIRLQMDLSNGNSTAIASFALDL